MNDHHLTADQSIREQAILSAYRQGILEARLKMLGGAGLLSSFQKYSSLQLLDLYAQQSTLIELCLLNNQCSSTLSFGTFLHLEGPSRLDNITQPSDLSVFLQSAALQDLLRTTIDVSIFPSILHPSVNVPSTLNSYINSDKRTLKEATCAETVASGPSLCRNNSGRNSSFQNKTPTKNPRRKKEKFKDTDGKCTLSRKRSIHDDAELLLEAALGLAPERYTNATNTSTEYNTVAKSMTHYENLVKDSELTCVDLFGSVPDFLLIAMAQMSVIRVTLQGQTINSKSPSDPEFIGMSCKHCQNLIGFGGQFFKSLLTGSHSYRIIKHVQHLCKSCPLDVKMAVDKFCTPSAFSILAKRLSDPDTSCQRYLDHISSQLVNAGIIQNEGSNDKNEYHSSAFKKICN